MTETMETIWPVGGGEIVTLISSVCPGGYTSTAHRLWSAGEDTLETAQMDPVIIHEAPSHPEVTLADFHREAVGVLEFRRLVDYDVADLFVPDP